MQKNVPTRLAGWNGRIAAGFALLAAAGMIQLLGVAQAGHKPDHSKGGPKDEGSSATGELFVRIFNDGAAVVNPDGSGLTPAIAGEPSFATHGVAERRWFLQMNITAGEYPNGDPRREIVAVSEDGNDVIPITSDASVQPLGDVNGHPEVRWATDQGVVDGKVSFTGRRLDADGSVVQIEEGIYEMGIYTVQIGYDEIGPVAMTPETLTWRVEVDPVSLAPYSDPEDPRPNTETHTWSPDGTQLLYDQLSGSALWLAEPADPASLTFLTDGFDPEWSPDGTAIAYEAITVGDIRLIAPDGSDSRYLVDAGWKNHTSLRSARVPTWSPDSAFLAYQVYAHNNGGDTFDTYVIGRDGSGESKLSSSIQDGTVPTAWR